MCSQGDRIYVGDIQEGVSYAKYEPISRHILVFADEALSRRLTCFTPLDYDTIAGADRFGNLYVSRLPAEISKEIDEDPTGNRWSFEQGYLGGASYKLIDMVAFFVNDTITSLNRAILVTGGIEVLVYTTLQGAIGCFIPFTTKEDVDFFQHLEMALRQEDRDLLLGGRHPVSYRGYYNPVKACIDGDLCEYYSILSPEKKQTIAATLDRTPEEILKKLEDIRYRAAF
jgi:splicing factor 3B subunit 3